MHLTRREQVQLYAEVVAATTGRLLQGKPNREERALTANEAHRRGELAVQTAVNSSGRKRK